MAGADILRVGNRRLQSTARFKEREQPWVANATVSRERLRGQHLRPARGRHIIVSEDELRTAAQIDGPAKGEQFLGDSWVNERG